jgi:hypothetical protein
MIRYSLYGGGMQTISHPNLCIANTETGDFLARAENSGCEGCYTEVARWSHRRKRWERFCFAKFLGGEDQTLESPRELATRHAAAINAAANTDQINLALIHRMPNTPENELAKFV